MCACNDGFRLNKTTGECVPNEKCPDLEPVKELKLVAPNCTKYGDPQGAIIQWIVTNQRNYNYSISSSAHGIVREGTLKDKTDRIMGFQVTDSQGVLTIPAHTLTPGEYTITVIDIVSDKKYKEAANFSIKRGCKNVESLTIDVKPTCQRRFSGAEISWAAKSDRSYEYIITKGDRVVKRETFYGSDNSNLPLSIRLQPGEYTVTVKDLDAGDFDYHTESKTVTLSACGFQIEAGSCHQQSENILITMETYVNRIYKYQILEEQTAKVVLEGAYIAGSQDTSRNIDSSDSLPVGRYILNVKELATDGEGHARFNIDSYGKINEDVKYRADAMLGRMYVCLDPQTGHSFVDGLTYKTKVCRSGSRCTSTPETTLQGQGTCFPVPYNGDASTLNISVQKDGVNTEVTIPFRG
jgi:hypothetical protein